MGHEGNRQREQNHAKGESSIGETLIGTKRRRLSDEPQHSHDPAIPQSLSNKLTSATSKKNDEWQVIESRSPRKRKVEADDDDSAKPQLVFRKNDDDPLRMNDLQTLALWILSDGVAPTWVGVRNRRAVKKVMIVMVTGLNYEILDSLAHCIQTDCNNTVSDKSNSNNNQSLPNTESNERSKADSQVTKAVEIVPVKVPGDSRQGKVHSPIQAMLLLPTAASKDKKGKSNQDERSFRAVQTPIRDFIHNADELREAEYPIHPASFINEKHAELEKIRREKGQFSSNGWVDTKVDSLGLGPSDFTSAATDPITTGYTVYALDCEMVLTCDDVFSLARISIVDWAGKTVIDEFVRPTLPVKNYFTQFSGITAEVLENVETTLDEIQQRLLTLFTPTTILLGHSLENDLNALKMTHPLIVDTSIIYPHPRGLPLRSSLKFLANKYLKREIQKGGAQGHDSVEDAKAVLDLVKLKCEKGPSWGASSTTGDSIFRYLANSGGHVDNGRTSAIVEYGTPDKGFAKDASVALSCHNDSEVEEGLIQVATGEAEGLNRKGVDFTWGRFRELEFELGWNKSPEDTSAPTENSENPPRQASPRIEGPIDTDTAQSVEALVDGNSNTKLQIEKMVKRLHHVYTSLPADTLFIVYSGTGDMREVVKLQQMHQQYRREFKIKKWDELSIKWTDTEEQALRRAVNEARKGMALLCLK